MSADAMHDELDKIARGVQSDVEADFDELDTSYDLWIEELRDTKGTRQWFGVIDMGEAYQGVYIWDGRWEHDLTEGRPHHIIDRIIRHRNFQNRHQR
jgi:hypothetical protein